MAESIFSIMQQASEAASVTESKLFGVEVAIVTNNKDPQQLGRIKVCFPRLPTKPESDWLRLSLPCAGPGRGFYWVPEVNDEVLVAFERGEPNRGYVLGALWNGKDKPMGSSYRDDNTLRMIQTKSGHIIQLDDKAGEEKIVIADKSGKRTLTWDVKAKKYIIQAEVGDVEIHAPNGKVVIDCKEFELKTKEAGSLDIGADLNVTAKQKANFKAGPQLTIKASRVNIN